MKSATIRIILLFLLFGKQLKESLALLTIVLERSNIRCRKPHLLSTRVIDVDCK